MRLKMFFLQLFAHEHQERWSKLVLAKLRDTLVLKDGVVFNNDYEGKPSAGVVKIPVRDEEVVVSDYDKANGISGTHGSTAYTNMPITKDKAVNEIIDGYDAESGRTTWWQTVWIPQLTVWRNRSTQTAEQRCWRRQPSTMKHSLQKITSMKRSWIFVPG